MAKMNQKINTKEVFERVIELETKFDMAIASGKKNTKRFTLYTILLIILLVTNILIHAIGMFT